MAISEGDYENWAALSVVASLGKAREENPTYYNIENNMKDWKKANITVIEIALRQAVDGENRKV